MGGIQSLQFSCRILCRRCKQLHCSWKGSYGRELHPGVPLSLFTGLENISGMYFFPLLLPVHCLYTVIASTLFIMHWNKLLGFSLASWVVRKKRTLRGNLERTSLWKDRRKATERNTNRTGMIWITEYSLVLLLKNISTPRTVIWYIGMGSNMFCFSTKCVPDTAETYMGRWNNLYFLAALVSHRK